MQLAGHTLKASIASKESLRVINFHKLSQLIEIYKH